MAFRLSCTPQWRWMRDPPFRTTTARKRNDKGLVASGPVSFGRIYSVLNETLRRGGRYKNGAIVLHLDINHPDIDEFITTPREQLPWVKRCVNITQDWWDATDVITRQKLIKGIKAGDIWLNKVKYHGTQRIRGNVCLEVYLPSRGTCLLQHLNLGQTSLKTSQKLSIMGCKNFVSFIQKQVLERQENTLILPLIDKLDLECWVSQISCGDTVFHYEQFGRAIEQYLGGEKKATVAYELVAKIDEGIQEAAKVARNNDMVRAFAIAPTASCSYRSKDAEGYTCTPEIAPPIARTVDRDSGTFGVQTYEYGNVEIASEVGWENYKRVADGIMRLYNRTGLLHGYSFNWWSDLAIMDNTFIEEWLESPQTSLYYSLQVMGDVQDKSDAYAALDEAEVDDYLASLMEDNEPQCDCAE